MKTTLTDLKQLNPCDTSSQNPKILYSKHGIHEFAKSKNSLLEAWNTCERGDWMLWFAFKLDCPVELLTLAKGKCAETVLHLMRDDRSRNAVKVAIDFGNGVATREALDAASDAAKAAAEAAFDDAFVAYAAAASNAAYAAYAATTTDAAVEAAADSAADAAAADYTDAYAADPAAADFDTDAADADADAARKENQALTANICWEILTDFIKSKI